MIKVVLHNIERLDYSQSEICYCHRKLTEIDLRNLHNHRITLIDLSHNYFSAENLLKPLGNLGDLCELDLSYNILRRIDLSPLHGCKNLKKLDLSHNRIHALDLNLQGCTSIEAIHLNNNMIESISLNSLSLSHSLTVLDLANNHMDEIDLTPVVSLSKLDTLGINTNAFVYRDVLEFPMLSPAVRSAISTGELEIRD